MSTRMKRAHQTLEWLWEHVAAGVAVALILIALVIGYRIGKTGSEATSEVISDPHDHTDTASGDSQMYTCSMHPQVRLPDPDAKCPICFMDLIPVNASKGVGNDLQISMGQSAATMNRIETTKVARFFPTAEVRLYGKVTFDETSVARLTAYFPGRIERLFVNYIGVPVTKGDHMAEIYSPEVLAAFEELRQSTDSASSTSELVRSTAGDIRSASREKLRLFGLTTEQIHAVEDGSFDSDRLEIYAPIGGVVTHLAVREGDYVQTGAPIATVADLSRLWLNMEAYESQLPLLRWGQEVTFTVESHPGETFNGHISFIEPMVDDRTRTAAVRVSVDNTDGHLKPGMFASAVVRTRIASDGAVVNDELAGRWVSPMHPSVVKDEPGSCDVCGMAMVPAESLGIVGDPGAAQEPLVIPRSAVLFTGKRSVVYVEVPDVDAPTYEGRTIVLGPRAGDFYIVREGLVQGELVVVHGAFRIDSAMQIEAKPSMMSPGGGGGANPHAGHDDMVDLPTTSVSGHFLDAIEPIYESYLNAQESLATDELSGFEEAVRALNAAVEAVDEAGLIGQSLGAWRSAAGKLRISGAITDIESARVNFEKLSEGVIALQRHFGHAGHEELNLVHCPMAFDNTGADWLQRGTQISNPYFGAMMLRCGDIRQTFEPVASDRDAVTMEGHRHE